MDLKGKGSRNYELPFLLRGHGGSSASPRRSEWRLGSLSRAALNTSFGRVQRTLAQLVFASAQTRGSLLPVRLPPL